MSSAKFQPDERIPEFRDRHTMLFGPKRSGKSNWLQYALLQTDRSHLIYDTVQEHGRDGINRYLPTHRRGEEAQAELNGVLERLVTNVDRDRRPEIVAIEEVSRFAPNRGTMPASLDELVDLNRHYGVGLIGVGRRPARVNADLVELADQLIIFRMRGTNDIRRLENEAQGLGEAARDLDRYEWLKVEGDRSWQVMDPVPEMQTTGDL